MVNRKQIIIFIRNLYNYIPFKKYFFLLIKNIYCPNTRLRNNLYFKGVYTVYIDTAHKFKLRHYGYGFTIENDIFWKGIRGGWEKFTIDLWIKLCNKRQTVLDIGANTGIYSLLAKGINSNSEVYAFEPVERIYQKLVANNSLNSFDINWIQYAASNYDGNAILYDPGTSHLYSVTVNENLNAKNKTEIVDVKTTSIDTFIEEQSLTEVSLVKIDVETHEPEVLEGFSKGLRKFEPTIFVEILKDEIGERIEKILTLLQCNYLYFNIDEDNGPFQVKHLQKSSSYNYLLCNFQIAKDLDLLKV